MEEKYYFMNSSDGIPSKWHIIQHSTKFGKVLKYFYHFIVDLESNSEFSEKNKVISKIFILLRNGAL